MQCKKEYISAKYVETHPALILYASYSKNAAQLRSNILSRCIAFERQDIPASHLPAQAHIFSGRWDRRSTTKRLGVSEIGTCAARVQSSLSRATPSHAADNGVQTRYKEWDTRLRQLRTDTSIPIGRASELASRKLLTHASREWPQP